jgi:peptidoglycan LD-endopeptidase CwlK
VQPSNFIFKLAKSFAMSFFIIAALTFLFLLSLVWLALFPGARDSMLDKFSAIISTISGWFGKVGHRTAAAVSESNSSLKGATLGAAQQVKRQRYLLLGILALIVIPPVLVLTLRGPIMLEGYEQTSEDDAETMIAKLLEGERLVPPPPLLPEAFVEATEEAVLYAPKLGIVKLENADRRWDKMDPEFVQRVLAVMTVMREKYGYEMVLVEGYRSPERQAEVFAAGKSQLKGGKSYHQKGLAVDLAISKIGKNGKLMPDWDTRKPEVMRGYNLYGQTAIAAGLTWGGCWSFRDYVHMERSGQPKKCI